MMISTLHDATAFVSELTGVPADCLGLRQIPEEDFWIASESIRGGFTLLVGTDGSVLFFHRVVVPLDNAVADFKSGSRTDVTDFDDFRERKKLYWSDPSHRQTGRDRLEELKKYQANQSK